MTDSEKRNIIDEVLLAIRTNSRTINQLMPVSSLNGTDSFEVSGGRRVSFSTLATLISSRSVDQLRTIQEFIGALPIIHAVPFAEGSDTPDVWRWKLSGLRASVTMLHGNTQRSLDHPAIVEVNGEFWLWKSSADVTQRIAGEFDLESAGGSTTDTSVWVMSPQTDNVQLGLTNVPVEQRKRGMLASLIIGGKWVLLQSKHTAEDDLTGQQWHNMNCWTIVAHEDANAAKNYQAIQAIKDATCDIAPSDILPYSDYINLGVQSWDSLSDVDAEMLAQMLAEKNKMLMYNVLLYWRKGDTMIAWQYTAEPEDWENQPMASGIDVEENLNIEGVREFLALSGWEQVYPTWQLVPKSDAQFAKLDEQFFDINSRLWMKAEAGDVAERFDNIGATDIDEYMAAKYPITDIGSSLSLRSCLAFVIYSGTYGEPGAVIGNRILDHVLKWQEGGVTHYLQPNCTFDELFYSAGIANSSTPEDSIRALFTEIPTTTIEGLHGKVLNNELAIEQVDANARRVSQYRIFDLRGFQQYTDTVTDPCSALQSAFVNSVNWKQQQLVNALAPAVIDFRFAEGDIMAYKKGEETCFARFGTYPLHKVYDNPEVDLTQYDNRYTLLMRMRGSSNFWTDVDIRELGSTEYLQKQITEAQSQIDSTEEWINETANPNFRVIMQGLIDRERAVEHIEAESAEDLFPNAYNLADDAPNVANATSIEGAIGAWLNAGNSNTDGVLKNRLTHGGIKFLNADTGAWECYIYEGTEEQWMTNLANAHSAPDEAVIAAMLTRTPQAVNIRQLYGEIAKLRYALEALTANTVEMEVTYDDDTTEVFNLINVPSAVAPTTQEEEE